MSIPTDSPLVLALMPYDQSDVLTTTTVTYGFHDAGLELDEGPSLGWTEPLKQFIRDAFDYLSTIINLTFEERDTVDGVTMRFSHAADLGEFAGYVIPQGNGVSEIAFATGALFPIFDNNDNTTVLHEIGHALGLSHPHDGPALLPGVTGENDAGDFMLNTELATRMSYVPGAVEGLPDLTVKGEAATLGAIDIAVLHLLYQPNTTTGLGDTAYGIPGDLITIWDNGGFDAIDFSAATDDAVINLTSASLALERGGGGELSYIKSAGGTVANGGYTIAFGVEIEDAYGGAGADQFIGNDLENFLFGNGGNDLFFGAGGNDRLHGGDGTDLGVYAAQQSSTTLTLSADATTLTDRTGLAGTDTLIEMEQVQFGGLGGDVLDLTIFAGTQNLSADQMSGFVELYIAYFNRAPDALGLNFWGTAFANGTTLEEMATLFIDQDETRATYPGSLSNRDFATAVYDNVLGRVPDQEGFDFWVGVLDAGSVGRDQFILGVLEGAKAAAPEGATNDFIAQQIADRQFLSIKTDIGAYYSVTKGLSDVGNASAAMSMFDGSAASVTAAAQAIDGYFNAALDAQNGQFLMPLVGVLDDPFAGLVG